MHYVPPNSGERYFLRLLLAAVLGQRSFKDAHRTVAGRVYPTYRATCVTAGLLYFREVPRQRFVASAES